jgi:hypothetical protein
MKQFLDLNKNEKELINQFMQEFNKIRTIELSILTQQNIGELKKLACELFTE